MEPMNGDITVVAMHINKNLIGLSLCGGQSIRMGNDKGLIITGGLTWAEIAFYKLSALGIPVFTSVNDSQKTDYQKIFFSRNLIIDNSSINVKGPLKGLLSLHNLFPEKDIIILACDMLGMRTTVLQKLQQIYVKNENMYDVYIYQQANYLEPLVAIYRSSFLRKISNEYKNNALKQYSLQYLISREKIKTINIIEENKLCFANYNYPSDISEYQQLS